MRFSLGPFGRLLLVVALLTVAGAAVAAGYAYTAESRYRATAQLIVSPVSASDPTYLGLGLLRDTGGKRTAAASADAMLRSPQVADAVRTELGLTRSRDSLLAALHAHAVDSSDVVDVTVEDTSPVRAAQLANAFASALVSQRTASFQSQLTTAIRRAQEQVLALPPNQRATGAGAALEQRLTVLRSLQGNPDPTIRPADQAEAPTAAIWPRRPLLIGIGAGAGFLVGLVVVALLALARRSAPAKAPARRDASARSVDLLAAAPVSETRVREEELEQRAAAVAAREEQVEERAEVLERRTTELEERAEALEQRTAELETRTEAQLREIQEQEKAEREAAVSAAAEREAAEAERKAAAEREAAERETREREAREREAAEREAQERAAQAEREAAERAAEAERAAAAAPAPTLEPAATAVPGYRPEPAPSNGSSRGQWNLIELQRLVEERGGDFPDRVDEWSSYLFFLRDYAEPDGSVPASFDWLIEDEFAELV